MRFNHILFLALVFIAQTLSASPKEIADILSQPENKIDLGRTCLILAKDAYPDFNIDKAVKFFDVMAQNVQQMTNALPDSIALNKRRVTSLNLYLFSQGAWNKEDSTHFNMYGYDSTLLHSSDQSALFLPHLLKQGQSTYPQLTMLWYVIADRLGWPVSIMRLPYQQVFIKCKGTPTVNVDIAQGCSNIPDSLYLKTVAIPAQAIASGAYMRPLTKKEYIASLLSTNAFYCTQVKNDPESALAYSKLAIKYDPKNAEALAGYGILAKDPASLKKAQESGLVSGKK